MTFIYFYIKYHIITSYFHVYIIIWCNMYIILSHPLSLPAAQPPWSEACFQLPKTPKFHVTRSGGVFTDFRRAEKRGERQPCLELSSSSFLLLFFCLNPLKGIWNWCNFKVDSLFFANNSNQFVLWKCFFFFKVFEGCFTVGEMNFLAMAATHHKVSLCQNWAMVVFFFHLFPFQAVCSDFCEEIHIQII